ncbi:MAG TPA: phosphoenolpyruvate carboxykinase (ATP) [Acidobacteriota bacterium]|nr:phosphoenolpyruvate carboxykinase (ATP) [Acidobacteriota bacterium]
MNNTTKGQHPIDLSRSRLLANLTTPRLIEAGLRRDEGVLVSSGAFCAETGDRTGRSPNDKFIVEDPHYKDDIWWGAVNRPFQPEAFSRLREKVEAYIQGIDLFVFDGFAGADPEYRLPVRIVTERAWHNLFARQLFIRPQPQELEDHQPGFTVISVPGFKAHPETDGTNSEVFILVSFARRLVLIGGTEYAGEIKKSIFSVMNYLMPKKGVVSMHCSANKGESGDTALFFGLSGTGKTTLSADPQRRLIGDDEHGWSNNGIFNFEGGCYAKCIRLSRQNEPQIWDAIRFGAVVENVVFDKETRQVDYDRKDKTENTRAAYPIEHIPGAVVPSVGGHPGVVIFLTADAFGVLPPISRLSREQTMYHFISGYTSKLAGTETGVTEPEATFSACFGAPFLPLHPQRYAELLARKINEFGSRVYLVNTGWTGGPHGVGERISLPYTRAMISAALSGAIDDTEFKSHPVFQVDVPQHCPGVPSELLNPKSTWADASAYDAKAVHLAQGFKRNIGKFEVDQEILDAGPRV